MATTDLYLLYTLSLDVDSQPLRLVGCIGASGGEFRFLAGRTLPFDVSGLIAESGAATTEQD